MVISTKNFVCFILELIGITDFYQEIEEIFKVP